MLAKTHGEVIRPYKLNPAQLFPCFALILLTGPTLSSVHKRILVSRFNRAVERYSVFGRKKHVKVIKNDSMEIIIGGFLGPDMQSETFRDCSIPLLVPRLIVVSRKW